MDKQRGNTSVVDPNSFFSDSDPQIFFSDSVSDSDLCFFLFQVFDLRFFTTIFIFRAGHFRYFYRSFDIRYLLDTEKRIEISDFKSIGRSNIGPPNFDSPILSDTEKNIGTKKTRVVDPD
jgi:hypothetical protein